MKTWRYKINSETFAPSVSVDLNFAVHLPLTGNVVCRNGQKISPFIDDEIFAWQCRNGTNFRR